MYETEFLIHAFLRIILKVQTNLRGLTRLYKKFRASGSQAGLPRYLSALSHFTVLNAQSYKNYLARCKTQFTLDPKQFSNFVNKKRKSSSYPSSLKFENSAANTDQAHSFFKPPIQHQVLQISITHMTCLNQTLCLYPYS